MKIALQNLSTLTKVSGSILLISGTAVGGGMLALPVVTAPIGFIPSIFLFLITWSMMTFTAFLLLEANINIKGNINLISMCRETLGPKGESIAWITYVLLLYSLLAVYISGTNSVVGHVIYNLTGKAISTSIILGLIAVLFIGIAFAGIKLVDVINKALIVIAAICYLLLLSFLSPIVTSSNFNSPVTLTWKLPFPILVTAFGFHIVIPSIVNFLNRDLRLIRRCLWAGSAIPLILYLGWQTLIVGSLQMDGELGLVAIAQSKNVLHSLMSSLEALTTNKLIPGVLSTFCGCAILTSLLGVGLSLFDFFKDALRKPAIQSDFSPFLHSDNKPVIACLTFIPPIVLTLFAPAIFTILLGYAGIFVSILLGLLPITICLKGRQQSAWGKTYKVPANKITFTLATSFFIIVIILQVLS